jgi:protein associated with RNAse G/E
MKLPIGSIVTIQSYKHDQTLHRIWHEAKVLEENDDYLVVANQRTKVVEANGRFWFTKEPSVTYFYKKHWFNVIGILKPTGITYYCNLCSPVLCDEEAIKYIDYDLDVKVLQDGKIVLLDQNEFRKHRIQMGYPPDLVHLLEEESLYLQHRIQTKAEPFRSQDIEKWYQIFIHS